MKNGLLSSYHYENLLDLGAHFTKRTTVLYLEWSQVSDFFVYLLIYYLFIHYYLFIYLLFIYLFIIYLFIYLSRVTTFGFA